MEHAGRGNVAGNVCTQLEVLSMNIDIEPLSSHAMCRECSKEFSSRRNSFRAMYIKIAQHVKANPGHTVIGTEETRTVFKV